MAAVAWWWAIPGVALVLAVSWAAWTCRSFRTPSMHDSMSAFAEWSAALDRVRAATPVRPEPADDATAEPAPEPGFESP
ncbi:hypothetical protein [Embleya scabrispora]|uniref:hypothetical protein n=1 Tax=Embleya scabrispora TaxID=159449 RepID=UPI0003A5D68A|nr:hypothetical protein [Embleya scabrispora]MYS79281.1 hypothetical protein [Streptomyces sp. SID5474]